MNTDHIIHNTITNRMECVHCRHQRVIKMPVPIDELLAQFDAFSDAHKGCTAPQSETAMSGYVQGFDAGYGFVLHEIEQYIKRHDYEPRITGPLLNLLAHLKAGDKDPQK